MAFDIKRVICKEDTKDEYIFTKNTFSDKKERPIPV